MRQTALALLAIALWSPRADTPASHRYQIDFWNTQVFDYSAQGQPVQRVGFGYSTWLQIAYADSAPDLRSFTMIVDSARLTQGSLVPLPVDSLAGAAWRGLLRDGRVEEWAAAKDRPGAGHLRTQLWHFYPRVPAGITPGSTWTDTVSQEFKEVNGVVRFTLVSDYTVAGIDTVDGRAAWRLDAQLSWRQEAALQFARGVGSLNGLGTGTARYHVSTEDQTYLGGESSWKADLVLAVPGRSEVPVHDSTYSRVVLWP